MSANAAGQGLLGPVTPWGDGPPPPEMEGGISALRDVGAIGGTTTIGDGPSGGDRMPPQTSPGGGQPDPTRPRMRFSRRRDAEVLSEGMGSSIVALAEGYRAARSRLLGGGG